MKKALTLTLKIVNLVIIATFVVVVYYNNVLPNNYYVTAGNELEVSKIIETEYDPNGSDKRHARPAFFPRRRRDR